VAAPTALLLMQNAFCDLRFWQREGQGLLASLLRGIMACSDLCVPRRLRKIVQAREPGLTWLNKARRQSIDTAQGRRVKILTIEMVGLSTVAEALALINPWV
jgi:hypothetical protein